LLNLAWSSAAALAIAPLQDVLNLGKEARMNQPGSAYLVDYPFANRFYPGALDVLQRLRARGPTVILSDGDVVFQPRKVERSGISEAVDGHVLVYIHKEETLDDVERRYPAQHYVLVDDKPRILAAVKKAWGDRVTTIFPRQGQYARDANAYRAADLTVERIGDLVAHDLSQLLPLEVLR